MSLSLLLNGATRVKSAMHQIPGFLERRQAGPWSDLRQFMKAPDQRYVSPPMGPREAWDVDGDQDLFGGAHTISRYVDGVPSGASYLPLGGARSVVRHGLNAAVKADKTIPPPPLTRVAHDLGYAYGHRSATDFIKMRNNLERVNWRNLEKGVSSLGANAWQIGTRPFDAALNYVRGRSR